jgi:transposase-like protein
MTVTAGKGTRRRYSAGFKAEVVAACEASGVSVAGVALAHGLNANLVRRWLAEAGAFSGKGQGALAPSQTVGEFVPVAIRESVVFPDIRIELSRGSAVATVHWPLSASESCGAWLRDWLR